MEAPGVLLLGALVSLSCRLEELEICLYGFLRPFPPTFIQLRSVLRQGRQILSPFPVPLRGSQPRKGGGGWGLLPRSGHSFRESELGLCCRSQPCALSCLGRLGLVPRQGCYSCLSGRGSRMGPLAPWGLRFLLPCWLWLPLEVPRTARPGRGRRPCLPRASPLARASCLRPEGSFAGPEYP